MTIVQVQLYSKARFIHFEKDEPVSIDNFKDKIKEEFQLFEDVDVDEAYFYNKGNKTLIDSQESLNTFFASESEPEPEPEDEKKNDISKSTVVHGILTRSKVLPKSVTSSTILKKNNDKEKEAEKEKNLYCYIRSKSLENKILNPESDLEKEVKEKADEYLDELNKSAGSENLEDINDNFIREQEEFLNELKKHIDKTFNDNLSGMDKYIRILGDYETEKDVENALRIFCSVCQIEISKGMYYRDFENNVEVCEDCEFRFRNTYPGTLYHITSESNSYIPELENPLRSSTTSASSIAPKDYTELLQNIRETAQFCKKDVDLDFDYEPKEVVVSYKEMKDLAKEKYPKKELIITITNKSEVPMKNLTFDFMEGRMKFTYFKNIYRVPFCNPLQQIEPGQKKEIKTSLSGLKGKFIGTYHLVAGLKTGGNYPKYLSKIIHIPIKIMLQEPNYE